MLVNPRRSTPALTLLLPTLLLLTLITVLLFAACPAFATTRSVTNLNDSGAGSLRDTIAASASGDVINFAVSGTIPVSSGELGISRSLTIVGPSGGITLNANGSSRVFNITAGTVAISGLSIINGRRRTFDPNNPNVPTIAQGGGILNAGQLTLTGCSMMSNVAETFEGSGQGGGIYNTGQLTLNYCTLSGNIARGSNGFSGGGSGGAVFNASGGSATLKSCLLSNNAAESISSSINSTEGGFTYGGAIYSSSNLTLINCTLHANRATSQRNNSFHSGARGGAILSEGPLSLTNCTVSSNLANIEGTSNYPTAEGGQGGGFFLSSAGSLRNTIVAGNMVLGSDPANPAPKAYNVQGSVNSLGNNLIGTTEGSSGWISSDLTGTNVSPLNPLLGPLQDNGGPTQTLALQPTSAARDAGSDIVLSAPLSLTTDQRGPGFPRKLGTRVDIGAFEYDTPLSGPNFTVTNTQDHNDGSCGAVDCTLREAIATANATSGANTVTFKAGVTGTITLANGNLNITDSMTLQGPGAALVTLEGNLHNRIFYIDTPGITVSISGLSITKGRINVGSGQGAGIYNNATLSLSNLIVSDCRIQAGQDSVSQGGAIYNSGILTMSNCIVKDSWSVGGEGSAGDISNPGRLGGTGEGGGIFNIGTLTVNRCTINGNLTFGGLGGFSPSDPNFPSFNSGGKGGDGLGGGIANRGTLTLVNSTVSGNTVAGGNGGWGDINGDGGNGQGGGLSNAGTLTLLHCTFSGNRALISAGTSFGLARGGGIFQDAAGNNNLRNCLVAANTAADNGPDAFGAFSSAGYNLVGKTDGSSGFFNNGDQVGTIASPLDAKLGPLQDNGGPTATHALLTGSPAIDKGKNFGSTTDQRGQTRPYDDAAIANALSGDGSDIGAFEFAPPPTFGFTDVTYTVAENGANATITVVRSGNTINAGTVNFATSNGTATSGSDYTPVSGTLSFAPGDTSKTFTIPILNSSICESIETVNLSLSTPVGATLGSRSTATLSIYDDDCTYTINGRVVNTAGVGMPNILIARTGGSNVVTDSNGNYVFTGVKQGQYLVYPVLTPSLNGVSFNPPFYNVTVNTSNLSNIAFTATFSVSGRIANHSGTGIPNVQVKRTQGSSVVSVFTDSSGNYRFTGVRSGSYVVAPVLTPALSGMSFTPTSTNITVDRSNLTNINFIGMFSISGRITTSGGTALPNVLVRLSTDTTSTSVVTDSNGNYRFSNVRSGTYSITPSQTGRTFTPTSRSGVVVSTLSLTNQNFIGSG